MVRLAVYACVDLYLRFATGLSWTTIFMTHLWTPQMNYMRLAIAWVQFAAMVLMTVWTVCSYRALKLSATKKEITWLAAGWFASACRAAASDELRRYAAAA